MTVALRLALTLVASLLLWLPTVPSALANHESPEIVGLRYLLALVVARFGVGVLFRIVRAYAAPVLEELEADEADEDDEDESPPHDGPVDESEVGFGRRRDDARPPDADDDHERPAEVAEETKDEPALAS